MPARQQISGYRTFLSIDLVSNEKIDSNNEEVGKDVQAANAIEHIWVIKVDFLAELHKEQDDSQICTRSRQR
jgi:hypothetical protein